MEINENYRPLGKKILLRKLVKTLDKKYGDILIPHSTNQNNSMGVAEIVNMGNQAERESGLSVGDFVLYDYYSAYGNYPVYVITNWQNIIVQLTKQEADKYVSSYVISNYENK